MCESGIKVFAPNCAQILGIGKKNHFIQVSMYLAHSTNWGNFSIELEFRSVGF